MTQTILTGFRPIFYPGPPEYDVCHQSMTYEAEYKVVNAGTPASYFKCLSSNVSYNCVLSLIPPSPQKSRPILGSKNRAQWVPYQFISTLVQL
jgi:hypothetical protein